MPPAHRNTDARICGASTVVVGQGTVRVNGRLWAVENDPNTHGGGELIPSVSNVRIEGKLVIVHAPDTAGQDGLCPVIGPPHCAPATAQGSGNVRAGG